LDCPDDILEAAIKEIKKQETENKLQLDKDGRQVIIFLFRSPKT